MGHPAAEFLEGHLAVAAAVEPVAVRIEQELGNAIRDADSTCMRAPYSLSTRVVLSLASVLVLLVVPGIASGATQRDIFGAEPVQVEWSSCSFDSANGVLSLASNSPDARHLTLPFVMSSSNRDPYVLGSQCPGAADVLLTSVTSVSMTSNGPAFVGAESEEMQKRLGRVIPLDIYAPAAAATWINVAYGPSRPIPTSGFMAQALDDGLDVTGDGQSDIRVHVPNWDVALSSASGGTYDLRKVPARATDGVYYKFQKAAVRVLGPTSGPDVAVTMAAGSGNDHITLYGGDDYVASAQGNDVISTGAGDDAVFGGGGSDTIRTGPGDDWAYPAMDTRNLSGAGTGHDRVWLGAGDDRSMGAWRVYGGPGRDISASYSRGSVIDLGPGSDFTQFGFPLGQRIRCGSGQDYASVGLTETRADRRRRMAASCEHAVSVKAKDPFHMKWEPGYYPFDRRDANGDNITTGA